MITPAELTPAAVRAAYASGDTIRVITSGTSGRPRLIVRTAASWVHSLPVVAAMWALSSRSRAWVPGPTVASMNAFAFCLVDHVGAAVVDAAEDATHVFCTPSALHRLLDHDHDHRPLILVVAGDRLPASLADRAEAAGHTVHHYYGAAQLSFVGWGRDAESLRLFPQVRAEAIAGELWVSSPWLCLREEAELPSLRIQERAGETWMSVGDRGAVGSDGRLTVHGRRDAVMTAGATVVLADVEAALRPYARGEVVVISRPHPRLGAVLAAVCTDHVDADSLPAVARRELPASHRPRAWSVIPELPMTAAGKVDRRRITLAESGLP